jgi:hypothetical protein
MPNPITDVLWWINSEVDKLSGIGLARVTEVLDAAQAELVQNLQNARWLGTDDRYTAQVHRNALMQIEGALAHIRQETAPDIENTLRAGSVAAGSLATKHLIEEVQKFSSIFAGTVRPVALEAMSVIAQGKKTLYPRYRTSAARYAGMVGQDIRRQLAIGVVKGETIDQLTTRLARHGGPRGLVYTRGKEGDPGARAEMIAEGLFKRYRYWGERLARTEVVNAYNECALIGMDELEEDDPGYFKRWDAAVDGRTCLLCRAFDDLVVPLKGKFPLGFDKPPRHPNCRCACVIWRKEWDEADVRDNIAAEVRPGKKPGTVASVPHKIQTPEPDYKAEAGKRNSKGGKFPGGFPESKPASMVRLDPEPARPRAAPELLAPAPAPARRPRRSSPEVQASRQEAELARIARRSQRAMEQMERDSVRQARQQARDAKAEEARKKRELRELRKAQSKSGDANLDAVHKMKKQPMASTFHPSIEIPDHVKRALGGIDPDTGTVSWRGKITLEEATHAFAAPPGYKGKVIEAGSDGIRIEYFSLKDGSKAATLERHFYSKTEIHHSLFVIESTNRSAGFADTINGQAMLRYEKWGLKKISVDAAWVGRYKWAKMGYNFDDPSSIYRAGSEFINKYVPAEKRADYKAKLAHLVREPWKLADWDDGDQYFASFRLPGNEGKSEGNHPIGKAMLLHGETMGMWSGHIELGGESEGYKRALNIVQAASRK